MRSVRSLLTPLHPLGERAPPGHRLEYRVEQHAAILGDRLGAVEGRVAALAVVLL